ncbi:MAG: hypothetical protein FWE70_05385, partial [Oscillospiraceae bacterium]|nr:hypothetical protein [Oscillospiraceae bacterium]
MAAKLLWMDGQGKGHNVYCMARMTVELGGPAAEARLCVFADTHYKLYVNGRFAQFGPVRFDPDHPVHDEHDLTGLLVEGRNVIALMVNHIGHKVFRTIPRRGCFVTWGSVRQKDGYTVSLESREGTFKVREAAEYGRPSHKLSFALQAGEVYEQDLAEEGWADPGYDDSSWDWAVPLEDQGAFGAMEARAIPFMDLSPVKVGGVRLYSVRKLEDLYSFEVPMPFMDGVDAYEEAQFMACTTWVFSPVAQEVRAGGFYGQTFINGRPPSMSREMRDKPMRYDQVWALREGWNHYFCMGGHFAGAFYHYLALPVGKGLIVSADRDPASEVAFRRAPVIGKKEYESLIKHKKVPYREDEALSEIGGWVEVRKGEAANSACREVAWGDYAESIETLEADAIDGFTIRKSLYPDGVYMVLDLGKMTLFMQGMALSGIRGATVDFVYAELMGRDGAHPQLLAWVPLGDRVICSKGRDRIEWDSFHVKGARYLCVAIRGYESDVVLERLSLAGASYPAAKRGAFRCSDPMLGEVWEMGLRTLQSNMEDAYVDCSGRERGMYIRDSIIQYHCNLPCIGDHMLIRRCLELFAQSNYEDGKFRAVYPNTGDYTITDFALNMVEGLWSYYRHTGDASVARRYWGNVCRNLKWFNDLSDEREDGLLDAEWNVRRNVKAHYEGYHGDLHVAEGLMVKKGINSLFTFTYMSALLSAVRIAATIGREGDPEARDYEARYRRLKESCVRHFWDEGRGCYADTVERTVHSMQANALAAIAEADDGGRRDRMARHIERNYGSLFLNGYNQEGGVLMSP